MWHIETVSYNNKIMAQTLYKTDKARKGSLPLYQRWIRGIQSPPVLSV